MTEHGAYGRRLAACFRLADPPTLIVRSLGTTRIAVTDIRCDTPDQGRTAPIPREDAFLVGIQLRDCAAHELWLDGRAVPVTPWAAGTVTIYDLKRDPVARLRSPFRAMHFYLPRAALDEIADDAGAPRVGDLDRIAHIGVQDPMLRRLGVCLLPALARPDEASCLFVDHVSLALAAHAAQAYGGMRRAAHPVRGGLASWQERRAKELLDAGIDGAIPVARLASACGLSVSHFTRAFRQSTGVSPHRWLRARRLDRARNLLAGSALALSEVAIASGFADQSHFTRIFTRVCGISPGQWRRLNGRQAAGRPEEERPSPRPACRAPETALPAQAPERPRLHGNGRKLQGARVWGKTAPPLVPDDGPA